MHSVHSWGFSVIWTWIHYQLDLLIFAGCSLLGLAALFQVVRRNCSECLSLRVCVVLSSVLLASGYVYVQKVDSEQRTNLISHMSAFATTYAVETQKLGHADISDNVSPNDSRYLRLVDAQRRWLSSNELVSDIYTIRRLASGQMLLLVDSETDYDGNGVFDAPRQQRTAPGEIYTGFGTDDPGSAVNIAFSGKPAFISSPYTDRWGTWVSALHPMFDAQGRIDAVLGVDFPAQVWGRQIFNARLSVVAVMAVIEALLIAAATLMALSRAHLREQKVAATRLQQFKTTLDQTLDSVFMFRPEDFRFIYVNEGARQLIGYSEDELLSRTPLDVAPQLTRERLLAMTEPLAAGTHKLFTMETNHRHRDGHDIPVELSLQYVRQESENARYVAIVRNITERRKIEQELLVAARLDRLTGLPNRALFHDRLKQFMERTKEVPGYQFALMFLDFDRFKIVNDSLGHDVGDALLIEIATRLKDNLQTTDSISTLADGTTVSRLGGDEFVVILDDIKGPEGAVEAASRLISSLGEQYQLGDHQVRSSASIGIVCSNARYERAEDMVRDADTAMYEAKARGKACFAMFDDSMHEAAQQRMRTENDLRSAIGTEQLILHYQPIVTLEDGELAGVEALIRWQHPTRGMISPAQFLPIAEETRLILPISDWVLRAACRQFRAWHHQSPSLAPEYISINLSRLQLMQSDLTERILSVLREFQMHPSQLQVELTEGEIMQNRAAATSTLQALSREGIRLAIDDFGTGYSSLACLQEFPFSALKIDRNFVSHLNDGHDVIAVAHSVVTLADNLGIACIAEGIEDPVQLAVLQSMNCGFGQGHYLCPPGPPEEILNARWKHSGADVALLLEEIKRCDAGSQKMLCDPDDRDEELLALPFAMTHC